MSVVLVKKEKSQFVQFLLTLFFGAFGLLYSSGAAFLLMILIEIVTLVAVVSHSRGPDVIFSVFGFLVLFRIAEFIIGACCVSGRNRRAWEEASRAEDERQRDEERRHREMLAEVKRKEEEQKSKEPTHEDLDREIERLEKLLKIKKMKEELKGTEGEQ